MYLIIEFWTQYQTNVTKIPQNATKKLKKHLEFLKSSYCDYEVYSNCKRIKKVR